VVILLFLAAACLLAAGMALDYRVGLTAVEADQKRDGELVALNQLQDFFSDLKDAETGQRGYLLTGNEQYLHTYNQVMSHFQSQLESLQQLARAGKLPVDRVERLTELTRQKLAELDKTLEVRRTEG